MTSFVRYTLGTFTCNADTWYTINMFSRKQLSQQMFLSYYFHDDLCNYMVVNPKMVGFPNTYWHQKYQP